MSRTELAQLGEFGLIDRISKQFPTQNPETIKGIGDDCAVIDNGTDFYTVISTDMLVEGIHFDLSYVPLTHLGYKSVVVNVSDVAAMNAVPKQITVAIAVSNRFSVEAIDTLYEGIRVACEQYKVDLVGGDTTASPSGLVISVTVIGLVEKHKIAYRNTAQENDIICVSGDLGAAYMGLQVLEREKQVFLSDPQMQPELDGKEYIVRRQLKPEARMDIIYELAELDIVPTSMIDISDGLASELLHLCTQSGTGATIFEDKLPIDALTYNTAVDFNLSPITAALNGGEDYELLFTIRQNDFEKLKLHPDIFFIGFMQAREKGVNLLTKQENVYPITAQGWKHFES
ncbi:MAG: thiamine-phosphate kinase [Verrucomicrobia bacterium]|nr:thiamine-phosphate kinase [Cytophagales bacterium]